MFPSTCVYNCIFFQSRIDPTRLIKIGGRNCILQNFTEKCKVIIRCCQTAFIYTTSLTLYNSTIEIIVNSNYIQKSDLVILSLLTQYLLICTIACKSFNRAVVLKSGKKWHKITIFKIFCLV